MRKIYYIVCLVALFSATHTQAQVVLKALEGEIPFTPSAKCLERIKDRNYGDGEHNYIYCAVQGPNGKKWLNLNLGAEYAKEDSPYFNPEAQPVDNQDWKAFGNLFQYGRKADGHEIVTYLTKSDPTPEDYWKVDYKYSPTTVKQDAFNSNNQTVKAMRWYSNEHSALDNAWVGQMINNPCPAGYRVMSASDVYLLVNLQSNNMDLSGITSEAAPGIVLNRHYPTLKLILGPAYAYQTTGHFVNNRLVTATRMKDGGYPGTSGIHVGEPVVVKKGYDFQTWGSTTCLGYAESSQILGIPYESGIRGAGVDVYCGNSVLAVNNTPFISPVRCVEQ